MQSREERNRKAREAYARLTAGQYELLLAQKRRRYRNMTPAQRARFNEEHRRWRKTEDPAKRRARKQVWLALRRGDLQSEACEVCGDATAEAHHDDYARPLEVRWLCRKHHRAAHAKERER